MVDPTQVAVAATLIIAAFGGLSVRLVRAVTNAKKELITLQYELSAKATKQGEQIHDLVNGNARAAAEKLAAMETQLSAMRDVIAKLQADRVEDAKLREANATR